MRGVLGLKPLLPFAWTAQKLACLFTTGSKPSCGSDVIGVLLRCPGLFSHANDIPVTVIERASVICGHVGGRLHSASHWCTWKASGSGRFSNSIALLIKSLRWKSLLPTCAQYTGSPPGVASQSMLDSDSASSANLKPSGEDSERSASGMGEALLQSFLVASHLPLSLKPGGGPTAAELDADTALVVAA